MYLDFSLNLVCTGTSIPVKIHSIVIYLFIDTLRNGTGLIPVTVLFWILSYQDDMLIDMLMRILKKFKIFVQHGNMHYALAK